MDFSWFEASGRTMVVVLDLNGGEVPGSTMILVLVRTSVV